MRKTKLLMSLSVLVCFVVFLGCTAAKEGQLQTKATDVGAPAGVKSPDAQKVNVGYIEDVTFDRLKGKERVTLFVSKLSDFKVERISEETLMIKLVDMFVPEDFRKRLGYDLSKTIKYILPLQKTIEGKKWAYFEIALKEMIPYSVKEEKRRIIIDFDVSSLSYTSPVSVKKVSMRGKSEEKAITPGPAKGMPQKKEKVKKKYTGRRISIDFQDASIKSVLRLIAECGRTNIISGEDVKGNVTLHMKNVPWDQALDSILDINGLVMKQMGDVISVMTVEKMQKDEATRQAGEESRIKAELLHKEAEQKRLVETGKLRQISIEAKIVEATTSFSRNLGIQWGAGYQGKSFGILGGTNPSTSGVTSLPTGIGLTTESLAVNFPTAVAAPSVGMVIGGTQAVLNAQLSALETTGDGKIISSPKVTTLDNVKATIKQGEEIPYAVYDSEGNRTIEFKDAALQLGVKPKITPDGRISMEIVTTNDYADWTKTNVSNENPPINTSSVESTIVVKDGDTIVVGGIYKLTESKSISGVPGLSKIPILGWLFKTETKSKEKREILIFITPRLIKD
ncbi:MAG: secretin and TonB N-terminal domain-containing protein [Proteobacteria bacterium]|nr:secretin and TonB N-terminal domain-containing protein [Pseudomonadota bacterium]